MNQNASNVLFDFYEFAKDRLSETESKSLKTEILMLIKQASSRYTGVSRKSETNFVIRIENDALFNESYQVLSTSPKYQALVESFEEGRHHHIE